MYENEEINYPQTSRFTAERKKKNVADRELSQKYEKGSRPTCVPVESLSESNEVFPGLRGGERERTKQGQEAYVNKYRRL